MRPPRGAQNENWVQRYGGKKQFHQHTEVRRMHTQTPIEKRTSQTREYRSTVYARKIYSGAGLIPQILKIYPRTRIPRTQPARRVEMKRVLGKLKRKMGQAIEADHACISPQEPPLAIHAECGQHGCRIGVLGVGTENVFNPSPSFLGDPFWCVWAYNSDHASPQAPPLESYT